MFETCISEKDVACEGYRVDDGIKVEKKVRTNNLMLELNKEKRLEQANKWLLGL